MARSRSTSLRRSSRRCIPSTKGRGSHRGRSAFRPPTLILGARVLRNVAARGHHVAAHATVEWCTPLESTQSLGCRSSFVCRSSASASSGLVCTPPPAMSVHVSQRTHAFHCQKPCTEENRRFTPMGGRDMMHRQAHAVVCDACCDAPSPTRPQLQLTRMALTGRASGSPSRPS